MSLAMPRRVTFATALAAAGLLAGAGSAVADGGGAEVSTTSECQAAGDLVICAKRHFVFNSTTTPTGLTNTVDVHRIVISVSDPSGGCTQELTDSLHFHYLLDANAAFERENGFHAREETVITCGGEVVADCTSTISSHSVSRGAGDVSQQFSRDDARCKKV